MKAEDAVAVVEGRLDSRSSVPLYEQLYWLLRKAIESGGLPPGAALPSEAEFARRLGLSRQTVNVALTKLARRGLVVRRRRSGTFVAEPFVVQPLSGLYSFMHTLEAQGRLPGTTLLGHAIRADDRASPLLAQDENALVFELKRLRLVDGEPFAIETAFLPLDCGRRLPLEKIADTPLYDLLEEACGIHVTHAVESLQPLTLNREEALLLNLHAGEPAFLVERIGHAGERAVELRLSVIRGDRYRFTVHLERGGTGAFA